MLRNLLGDKCIVVIVVLVKVIYIYTYKIQQNMHMHINTYKYICLWYGVYVFTMLVKYSMLFDLGCYFDILGYLIVIDCHR